MRSYRANVWIPRGAHSLRGSGGSTMGHSDFSGREFSDTKLLWTSLDIFQKFPKHPKHHGIRILGWENSTAVTHDSCFLGNSGDTYPGRWNISIIFVGVMKLLAQKTGCYPIATLEHTATHKWFTVLIVMSQLVDLILWGSQGRVVVWSLVCSVARAAWSIRSGARITELFRRQNRVTITLLIGEVIAQSG